MLRLVDNGQRDNDLPKQDWQNLDVADEDKIVDRRRVGNDDHEIGCRGERGYGYVSRAGIPGRACFQPQGIGSSSELSGPKIKATGCRARGHPLGHLVDAHRQPQIRKDVAQLAKTGLALTSVTDLAVQASRPGWLGSRRGFV
jgi:hypothetical protein